MVIINKVHIITIVFLMIGIILNLIPLPDLLAATKPPILLLILIYWSLAFPKHISLTYAFVSGVIMDILLITPIGYHALCFTITIYLILIYYPQMRLQSSWNKMASLLIILIPYFLMSTAVNNILGISFNLVHIIFSVLISVIIWPGLFNVLRFIRQKYTS